MPALEQNTINSDIVIVRLLNSSLRGCEFALSSGKTHFLVEDSKKLLRDGQLPSLPADTLYIPLENGGINFELVIATEGDVILRQITDTAATEAAISFNQVINIGELRIAVRLVSDEWLPEILNYVPETRIVELDETTLVTNSDEDESGTSSLPSLKGLIPVALAFLVLAVGAGWFWNHTQNSPVAQEQTLASLLGHSAARFLILEHADNQGFYVIADNEQDGSWATRALMNKTTTPVQIISRSQEINRITNWFMNNFPELIYYRLDLANPQIPQLWVSKQRTLLTEQQKSTLLSQLKEQLPYAQEVQLLPMDDDVIIQQAITGLNQNALQFVHDKLTNSVSFIIKGELNDSELMRARTFINEYYQQWGSRYVRFTLELQDNVLKNKSFLGGQQGYIKLAPSHWFFSSL